MAIMSILGLYRWNNSLFDNMVLPENFTQRDDLIDNLLLECAELEILYPDFDFMKFAIGAWSKKQLPVWEKLFATLSYDYDPIANYDRKELWEDVEVRDIRTETTPNLLNTRTPGAITTTSKQGFNTEGFVPQEKQEMSGSDTVRQSGSESGSQTDNHSLARQGRAYGNIGVTTTQQMIEQERKVSEYNIIDVIIDDFKRRFCLLVY